MLAGTVALNSLDNVYLYHNVVSDRTGETIRYPRLDYSRDANFGAFEIEPARKPDFDGNTLENELEQATTVAIDDLGLRNIRLIKLDIEGMEYKALLGAQKTLRASRPLLFLEYEKTDFDAVKLLLKEACYVSYYAQRPNILCMPQEFAHVQLHGAQKVRY